MSERTERQFPAEAYSPDSKMIVRNTHTETYGGQFVDIVEDHHRDTGKLVYKTIHAKNPDPDNRSRFTKQFFDEQGRMVKEELADFQDSKDRHNITAGEVRFFDESGKIIKIEGLKRGELVNPETLTPEQAAMGKERDENWKNLPRITKEE